MERSSCSAWAGLSPPWAPPLLRAPPDGPLAPPPLGGALFWLPPRCLIASSRFHFAARSCGRNSRASRYARSASARCESRSEEHTSELQSQSNLVCRLLLEKKKK